MRRAQFSFRLKTFSGCVRPIAFVLCYALVSPCFAILRFRNGATAVRESEGMRSWSPQALPTVTPVPRVSPSPLPLSSVTPAPRVSPTPLSLPSPILTPTPTPADGQRQISTGPYVPPALRLDNATRRANGTEGRRVNAPPINRGVPAAN